LKSKVIVIGAGVSGISAAMHLAKSGHEVQIYEAKNFIGGRVYSFTEKLTGETVDNGQHVLSGAYTEFLKLLDELGTSVYLNAQPSLVVNFADSNGKHYCLDTGKLPGKLGMFAGFLNFDALSFESKLSLFRFILKLRFLSIDHNERNCRSFLLDMKQNKNLLDVFWKPLILAVLNDKPENVSAKLLIEVLQKAFFAGGNESGLILPAEDLSKLLNPFEKWIGKHGGQINLQSAVQRLIKQGHKVIGVRLKDGGEVYADYVVSTIQPNSLKNIIGNDNDFESDIHLPDYDFSTIINIYYWLDKHVNTPDFSALIGTKAQWMFNRRNFIQTDLKIVKEFPGLVNVTISGANDIRDISSENLIAECFNELKQAFPVFKAANILQTKIIRDKRATITISPELEKRRPESETNKSRFLLAGDWTNTGLPATIEGAALSGKLAAERVITNNI